MITKDFSKDKQKVLDNVKKYYDYVSVIKNPLAKEFLLTFYSGQTKKGYDPQPMFTYFVVFIENKFGFRIEQNNENLKEFCQLTDSDGSLAVDLKELDTFFNDYVDTANQVVKLNMAKGLGGNP